MSKTSLAASEHKFITAWGPYREVGLDCPPEDAARSSFMEECDINHIIAQYTKTGQLPGLVKDNPQYGDFASVPDFQAAMDIVVQAQETFDALPAQVRAECGNNPEVFLDRVRDKAWAEKHKLALPPKDAPPSPASPAPTDSSAPRGDANPEAKASGK